MTKETVIERLCQLASEVGAQVFNHQEPHDCFCDCSRDLRVAFSNYRMSEHVIAFIEQAVRDAMKKHRNSRRAGLLAAKELADSFTQQYDGEPEAIATAALAEAIGELADKEVK